MVYLATALINGSSCYRCFSCDASAEADAQVAFLAKCGLASAVITEDSDILVYMAAVKSTASVLYKLDEFGKCKELGFDAEKLSSLPGAWGQGKISVARQRLHVICRFFLLYRSEGEPWWW